MLEYKGKYGSAKVMIDEIDQETVSQIYNFLNHPAFTEPIAIMPDTHAGKGSVIGFTMRMTGMLIPNVIGVDINCGMYSFNVGKNILAEMSKSDIDSLIRKYIPFGTNVHKEPVNLDESFWVAVMAEHKSFIQKFNKYYGTNFSPCNFNEYWLKKKCDEIEIDVARVIQSIGTLGGGK